MKTEVRVCDGCNEETKQILLGFIPLVMVYPLDEAGDEWIKSNYCTSCKSLIAQEVTDEELAVAEERYLHALVEHGEITEEKAQDVLGLN